MDSDKIVVCLKNAVQYDVSKLLVRGKEKISFTVLYSVRYNFVE
jgi:hypothetical protein